VTRTANVPTTRAVRDGGPPALARPFLYGFLAVLLLTALLAVEWWPFTGWKLFSQLRTGTVHGWQVTTVDPAGNEEALDFGALPRGFSGWFQLAQRLPSMTASDRDELCTTWLTATHDAGTGAVGVRVYRTTQAVRTDDRGPAPPVERTFYLACGDG
jgi:hypothetical protein